MERFRVWHAYRKLVDIGLADPVECPDCGLSMHSKIHNDDFALSCVCDGKIVLPGTDLWSHVQREVERMYPA